MSIRTFGAIFAFVAVAACNSTPREPIVRTVEDKPDGLHAIGAVIDSPLGPLNLVAVHLTRPWPYQYQWGQITQVMALTKLRAGLTGPVIVR